MPDETGSMQILFTKTTLMFWFCMAMGYEFQFGAFYVPLYFERASVSFAGFILIVEFIKAYLSCTNCYVIY